MCKRLRAIEPHWLTDDLPTTPLACNAKTRYRQDDQSCVVTQASHDTMDIEFQVPQRAATPGQALVLYHGDRVLGGGTIDQIDYLIDE
jgi:tRNA-specific 2-thiouridylase